MVAAYIGLLAQGKSDFDHIEAYRADPFFGFSLGIAPVPSSKAPKLPWTDVRKEIKIRMLVHKRRAGMIPQED